MSQYQTILYEKKDKIAIVTLNRPDKNNAMNKQMIADLEDAMRRAGDDPEVRVILWAANGRNFQAGGDLEEFKDATPEFMASFNGRVIELWRYMERLRKPILGVIHGFCVMDAMQAFDLIIASDDVRFANPEIAVGVSPGAGITQRMLRWMSPLQAKQILFFPDPISSWEAARLGFVNWIVPRDRLTAEAMRIAGILANAAPLALGAIKMCINLGGEMDLDKGLEYQRLEQLPLFKTEDQKEGMRAFLEKRKPVFKGV